MSTSYKEAEKLLSQVQAQVQAARLSLYSLNQVEIQMGGVEQAQAPDQAPDQAQLELAQRCWEVFCTGGDAEEQGAAASPGRQRLEAGHQPHPTSARQASWWL